MLTYKLEIGAATYYADRIMPPLSVQKALCNYDALTIGNVCSKTLKVTIIPGNTIINRRAQVKLYSSSAEGTPEWTPRGTFYIDTRRKGINTLSLVCYDAVLMMSNTFIQNNTPAEWPISMRAAIQHICTQLGIEAENINDISDTFMVPYTNTLTMRDVACRIANAHCGNFIINDANKLQFISIVGTDIGICTPIYKNFKILADPYKFAKVIMFYDEQDYYGSLIEDELQAHLDAELPHKMLIDGALHDYGFIQEGVYLKFIVAGTGSYNEFITTNEYATQEIATNVYNTIKNYTHRPYEIINAIFDDNTILEVGDKFQINNTDYIFFEGRINYGNVISYDMTAPYDQEMIHEYPVTGQYLKEIKRKVSLGTNYYGTTIDRDNGLTIEREDGLSKVIMNSESMKWQVDKGAGLADRLYFDSVAGDLKYNGSLEIQQDDNKAKTIIDASETAIYGATGTAGALEKNFYVDSTGKIKVKNIELAGSMNLSVGSITWGDNNPVPSYIGATNIDMSSVTSPYVIAGSLQGSNFVHYPASTPGGLNVLGNAIRYINGWGSNIFQLPDEQVLTGFSVGSYVNVGPSAYSSAFISNAQISTFLDVTVWPATTTSTPTRTCLLNAAYFIPNDGNNTYPAYMSLASTESLGEPFVLYNVPITKHTDLSGYADNKIGGIKYENGGVVLNSVNGYSIKITSTGDVVITSSGVVLIDSPIVALSGRIISLTATSGYAYLNGQQIATV